MASEPTPVLLTTERLHLAMLSPDAAGRVLAYHQVNDEHLGPVSPAPPPPLLNRQYRWTRGGPPTHLLHAHVLEDAAGAGPRGLPA
jgi:hypothetical protein